MESKSLRQPAFKGRKDRSNFEELEAIQEERFFLLKARVNLEELVRQFLEEFRELHGLPEGRLSLISYAAAAWVLIDSAKIRLVLDNLLRNALQHAPEGGSIVVMLYEVWRGINVSVINSGEGIDPDDRLRLFKKFYRGKKAKYEGAGLGLYISKVIVESHGGRIVGRNDVIEGGAVFYFVLPKPVEERPRATEEEGAAQGFRVGFGSFLSSTPRLVLAFWLVGIHAALLASFK